MTKTISLPDAKSLSPAKLAHVVIRASGYKASIDWWMTVLNAHVQFQSPFLCFLTYDDEHHRLAIINSPDHSPTDASKSSVDHFAFSYNGLDELLATYERLKSNGIEPYWTINHGPTTSMYYRDPDGIQVELQVDNFSNEESNAWFQSEAFAQNPLGVTFDPEIMLAKYRAGVSDEALKQQGSTAD